MLFYSSNEVSGREPCIAESTSSTSKSANDVARKKIIFELPRKNNSCPRERSGETHIKKIQFYCCH